MIVGYARVSSTGQSLDVQLEKLEQYKCEKIFKEKLTGTTMKRKELAQCLDFVREGDVLVVTRLDRLARSTLHLCEIGERLSQKGVALVVIDQNMDTTTATGRLLFNMLAAIGQFETELRRERQADGIASAKERGIKLGRQPKLSPDEIERLRQRKQSGTKVKELIQEFGISKTTIYRLTSIE